MHLRRNSANLGICSHFVQKPFGHFWLLNSNWVPLEKTKTTTLYIILLVSDLFTPSVCNFFGSLIFPWLLLTFVSNKSRVSQLSAVICSPDCCLKLCLQSTKRPTFYHAVSILGALLLLPELIHSTYQWTKNIDGKVCLSIRQPYADLIVSGRKAIELRKWNAWSRGELFVVYAYLSWYNSIDWLSINYT